MNTILLIIAGTAAISCLLGTMTYLISISNEMQNTDAEKIEGVN